MATEAKTLTIDADAHVIETDRTWAFMTGEYEKYRPVTVAPTEGDSKRLHWIIDGKLKARRVNIGSDTTEASRELHGVQARLSHMDELGTDIQVLYPTIYTRKIADDPAADHALGRSYNRWLAEVWEAGEGRLRWVAIPPLMDLSKAREELEFAKEHGACGVFMRGFEGDRHLSDPYFFPLYDIAQGLDMPICVHAGTSNPAVANFLGFGSDGGSFMVSKLPVMSAFHTLLLHKTPERFPTLRFCFVEANAQWIPHMLHDLVRRESQKAGRHLQGVVGDDMLKRNRMYVGCQSDDDVPYLLQFAGEDNLIMGSDYGHADTASELAALSTFRTTSPVGTRIANKMLGDNAKTLYAL
jgi:predicted TIM-barrel fold metal-dependent hydrolase